MTVVTASYNLFLVLFTFLKESSITLVSILMMIALFSKLAFASTHEQVVCVCFICIFLNFLSASSAEFWAHGGFGSEDV